jgi:hypothetical protein
MRRAALPIALVASLLLPAAAWGQATSISCAAAVTHDLGPRQTIKDLSPSSLPILRYNAVPGEREFKHLATIDGRAIGLFVYRVNENIVHMQVYERDAEGETMLADTALQGDITELSYRPLGGSDLVTAYCYW